MIWLFDIFFGRAELDGVLTVDDAAFGVAIAIVDCVFG